MAQRYSTPTLSKPMFSDQRFAAGLESSPKNDISCRVVERAVRSTVSATVSKGLIWVNSTDFNSSVRAVKVHEILLKEFGYTDSLILEESQKGKGVSISVCDRVTTVKQMREDYAYAKKEERNVETTAKHQEIAKDLLTSLYGQ
ncbi:hypothetical protein H5300_06760 [Vibrio sp. SG41-7]|uniref:hypothetical protein n=1 Tax=Vibrio sp. SG41-7 TaxID=2760973 RepID=UPI0015FED73C|nr:hypothetical protein [Vibrio sp. SG41-7]MBB1463017.1 hypothetical protein [Vibrio sp. SG41-7]